MIAFDKAPTHDKSTQFRSLEQEIQKSDPSITVVGQMDSAQVLTEHCWGHCQQLEVAVHQLLMQGA